MPPKGGTRKSVQKPEPVTEQPTTPHPYSYLHAPRPFKNPAYTKNANRRAKNIKTVLTQEKERERLERERRKEAKAAGAMDVDGEEEEDMPTYPSIEAPPSLLPPKKYCDITGLEAPYTDPSTGLRYHDMDVYQVVKGLSIGAAKDYLSARGVNSVVK